jgi:hypothetical protein
MGSAKKRPSTATLADRFGPIVRLVGFLAGPGRTAVLVVLLVAAFAAGSVLLWGEVGPRVLASQEYLVGPQQVELSPPPRWIHSDIKAEVFRDASLDGPLSIMDDDLVDRIRAAFALHPWVARVVRVAKHHPARVEVEVEYRRPVLMVEVPGGLLPVDARGVLLPVGDFSPVEAARYPRLVGADTSPLGTVGQAWGDARVVGAAEIAGVLGAEWDELKLARIASLPAPIGIAKHEPCYVLMTRAGTRIVWGRAPGADPLGEPTAAQKAALLRHYASEHGSLDEAQAAGGLDLRTQRISAATATSSSRLLP